MPKPSDTVRFYPYPLLEEGNLSFPEGSYVPEATRTEDGFVSIEHRISGAPLIDELLDNGQATRACAFAVPITGHRQMFLADGTAQKIEWDEQWLGEPPFFLPLVVCNQTNQRTLKESDGVHPIWIGQKVTFERGAKIAIGEHMRPTSSLQSLLSIEVDENLGPGEMRVAESTERGFYFRVQVAKDIHVLLNTNSKPDSSHYWQCRSIYTHAVSSCFAILAKGYKHEDDWQEHPNLIALANHLERHELPIWTGKEFSPEETATKLHPHLVPPRDEDLADV